MYQRAKIYTIRSHQTDKVYVGSTVNLLCKRMGGHRKDYKYYLNGTFNFISSFTILEYGDEYIELHENYPCNSKEELHRREGEVIRELGEKCINKVIPGRTKKEYHEDNKDIIKEKRKAYYEDNIDKFKEKDKKYRQNNKEKIYERNKKYCEKNKDIIKEKRKEYYEKTKEKQKERTGEKIECECGTFITRGSVNRHKTSKKHQKTMEEIK